MEIYKEFMDKLKEIKRGDKATVVFLHGDLGSGKTTFTKRLCEYLNLDLDITSPTFTILKGYHFGVEHYKNLIHIDAYRLNSYDELLKIKFDEYLNDKENLIFIEWPSLVEHENLKADINVRFEHVEGEEGRKITID